MPKSAQHEVEGVEKALKAVRLGVNRLVCRLGYKDPAVVGEAELALDRLGAAVVVGPLGDALTRAKAPGHRLTIARKLISYAGERKAEVDRALVETVRREQNPSSPSPSGRRWRT